MDDVLQPYIVTAADYDGDGWMDLLASRPFHRLQLLRNRGDGTFHDVTAASGLLEGYDRPDQAVYTCVSSWADIDNDGHLDLFLAQFGQRFPLVEGLLARTPMPSRLYHNVADPRAPGGRRFEDVTDRFGLASLVEDRIILAAAFGDYDDDRFPDLYLSSVARGRSVLLRNVAGQRFEPTDLIETAAPGFTVAFVDVDHDGRLDLFRGSHGPARGVTANVVFGEDPSRYRTTIYRQTDSGFEDQHDLFEQGMPIGTMGTSYGDLNNDGALDFYLGTGNPEGSYVLPNLMYLGVTDGTKCTGALTNISCLFGFGTVQKGHGIVFFDFDDDGDQDVYSSLGGMWPGDAWRNQLFENLTSNGNAWVKIRLRGRETNRHGVGGRITVRATTSAGDAVVRTYHMNNKTGFGSAPYVAHIGLMHASRLDEVEVRWPGSGETRVYAAELRQSHVLDEHKGSKK